MASRSRGRTRKNNHTPGNTRTDGALDAMRPYGFDERLVRETVKELLDVYEGTQGWPFIEEASYKLLIETILGKQQISSEEKDNNAREGENVASVAPSTCANFEAGSSNLVAQDSLLVAPQTHDAQVSASLVGMDSIQFQVEAENERISGDNAIGSNSRNVDAKKVRLPVIRSSQQHDNVPTESCKPCYGWIEDDIDDGVSTQFPVEAENKRMSVDKSIGSNIRNADAKQVRPLVIQSPQPRYNYPIKRHKPSYGQIGSDINDEVSTQFRVEAEIKRMSADKSIGSNVRNVDATQVRSPVIQSSQPRDDHPIKRHKPSYGRIGSDTNDEISTQFRVEAEIKRMSGDKSIGSNVRNVDAAQVRSPMIQSSQPYNNYPIKRHKPSYGRIGSDINDEVSTQFRVEAEINRMSADKSIGSNVRNVDANQVRPLVIQSSQPRDNYTIKRHKLSYGWIGSDINGEVSTQFRVGAEIKRMSADKSIGSNIRNVDDKQMRHPVIQSSQSRDSVPIKRHKPSDGRIGSDINDKVSTQFRVEAEYKRISVDKATGSNIRNVDAKQMRLSVIQSSQPHHDFSTKRHKLSDGQIEIEINNEVSTQLGVEAENQRMSVDKSIGSNIKNVDAKQVRPPVIQQSQPYDVAVKRLKPRHGWISCDTSDEDLIRFPLPPLPEELIKSLRQNGAPKRGRRRRHKSRWDEKPDDVIS